MERALEGSSSEGAAELALQQETAGHQTSRVGIASQSICTLGERQPPAKLASAETLTCLCHRAPTFVLKREQQG
jgi:hypothetical protein